MATARCTWTAVSGVDGYNVYLKSNGTFVKQNSELITGTVYDIENLEDGNYEAYATSVLNSVESDASNVKGFVVSTEPEVEVFTADGTWDWTAAGQPSTVDVLVVAGGGSGASGGYNVPSGGGGGGGVIWEEGHVVSDNVNVVVGDGGIAPVVSAYDKGENGGDSSFGTLVATGGGGGDIDVKAGGGKDGGSGGGGATRVLSGSGLGGSGTPGQGNDGGDGLAGNSNVAGGGGGAGEVGETATSSKSGDGGDGLDYSGIFGTEVGAAGWFAGGGGGASRNAPTIGLGGNGGGGDGGYENTTSGQAGVANTGGGGGGSAFQERGGNGGSGIVIVRWIRP